MSQLTEYLQTFGRFPQVSLTIRPLDGSKEFNLDKFLSYSFDSSILVPVDSFSFSFTDPQGEESLLDFVQEGDIALIKANDTVIATGIIDQIEIETSTDGGEVVHVKGRDLMSQLEDQSCVNDQNDPIWSNKITVASALKALLSRTRIPGYILQQVPAGSWLFATAPGESKLTALQRLLEPLNCVAWTSPQGYLTVGRPNMAQAPSGTLKLNRVERFSNVLSMKAVRSSTQIPNIIIPIWSGQENVQSRVKEQALLNKATGPARLRGLKHYVPRAVVVSSPQGSDPQSLSDVNQIVIAGSTNILNAYALKEMAKANFKELIVEAQVPGHFNDDLAPFLVDRTYQIEYERAKVSEKMYLFQCTYTMDASKGQRTNLMFCKLGRIVANISKGTPTVSRTKVTS